MRNREKFVEERFVTCKYCGYNNFKERLRYFGACLRCNKIIDERSYFKRKVRGEIYGKEIKRTK